MATKYTLRSQVGIKTENTIGEKPYDIAKSWARMRIV